MHPAQAGLAFLFVAGAFLGLGLLIAAVANDVPAVQALGQCLFLPMIMIGGVGVPLAVLPVWAQRIAGFMPGRYAVEVLQRCFSNPDGLRGAGFSLLALVVIGGAAAYIGAKRFRWDVGEDASRFPRLWITLALLSWIAVGLTALLTGRLKPGWRSGRRTRRSPIPRSKASPTTTCPETASLSPRWRRRLETP